MSERRHNADAQHDWERLIAKEEEAFQRCCELDRASAVKTKEKAAAVREWWKIANAILWMHVRTLAQEGVYLEPYPAYALGRLANICEEIGNGKIPPFVVDAAKSGVVYWRRERHHIAYGILYIEAVRSGLIADRAPVKRVADTYNVTRKAVQGWIKRRDEICVGVPHRHLSPEQITQKMEEAGAVYARIGRGAPSSPQY